MSMVPIAIMAFIATCVHSSLLLTPLMLYCSQATQTQPESKYEEAESLDFTPIRIGKPERMSPASAMYKNQYQLSLSDEEEPPQLCCHQQCNAGLGRTNILNIVDTTALVQHRKMTLYLFAGNQANLESKCKGVHSHQTKSLLK